jgi:hypothetical protein
MNSGIEGHSILSDPRNGTQELRIGRVWPNLEHVPGRISPPLGLEPVRSQYWLAVITS